jgi:hypothetical protein
MYIHYPLTTGRASSRSRGTHTSANVVECLSCPGCVHWREERERERTRRVAPRAC